MNAFRDIPDFSVPLGPVRPVAVTRDDALDALGWLVWATLRHGPDDAALAARKGAEVLRRAGRPVPLPDAAERAAATLAAE